MAEVTLGQTSTQRSDAIADYIALDNPEAARRLVQKIFEHVEHLESHPRLGLKPDELKGWRDRQIVESVSYLLPRRFWASLNTSRHASRALSQGLNF